MKWISLLNPAGLTSSTLTSLRLLSASGPKNMASKTVLVTARMSLCAWTVEPSESWKVTSV